MAEQERSGLVHVSPYVLDSSDLEDSSHLLLFHGRDLLLNNRGYFWQPAQLADSGVAGFHCLPVHGSDGGLYAAVTVTDSMYETLARTVSIEPVSTRSLLLQKGFEDFLLFGRASQLSNWYRTHQYCGACGSPNVLRRDNRVLGCDACGLDYYPRINPCVIVLVTRGNRVLLARSARRGADFFSCIAGFMEIGETPEQTVEREVQEETGIRVHNIQYVQSQSWPFPSQLMLGFIADYIGGELRINPEELAEADWFDVDDLPVVPAASISVAGQLINQYQAQVRDIKVHKNYDSRE